MPSEARQARDGGLLQIRAISLVLIIWGVLFLVMHIAFAAGSTAGDAAPRLIGGILKSGLLLTIGIALFVKAPAITPRILIARGLVDSERVAHHEAGPSA